MNDHLLSTLRGGLAAARRENDEWIRRVNENAMLVGDDDLDPICPSIHSIAMAEKWLETQVEAENIYRTEDKKIGAQV